jgi:hypothetical protein
MIRVKRPAVSKLEKKVALVVLVMHILARVSRMNRKMLHVLNANPTQDRNIMLIVCLPRTGKVLTRLGTVREGETK